MAGLPAMPNWATKPGTTRKKPGIVEEFKGLHDRAIQDFDRAIQLKPDWADAFMERGFVYGSKGDSGRAQKDFDEAKRLERLDYE